MASGEFGRIRWLRRAAGRAGRAPVSGRLLLGIGDDAALLALPEGRAAVLTVDAQVEGVHFRPGWLGFRELGARAVAAAASDLAAMAALPSGLLLAFTLPRRLPERCFRALYRGALAEATRLGFAVLGGNLSAGPLGVSVTAVGTVRPRQALRRAGARAGDGIYTTGWPGRAAIGRALLAAAPKRRTARGRSVSACLRAFKAPRPRIHETLFIARRARPSAGVDLSDGLAADLGHILEESGRRGRALGARIDPAPLRALLDEDGCAALALELGLDPLEAALAGGEDYEVLFTASPGPAERAARDFRRRFRIPLTRVGTVAARPGLVVGRARRPSRSFDHFVSAFISRRG